MIVIFLIEAARLLVFQFLALWIAGIAAPEFGNDIIFVRINSFMEDKPLPGYKLHKQLLILDRIRQSVLVQRGDKRLTGFYEIMF